MCQDNSRTRHLESPATTWSLTKLVTARWKSFKVLWTTTSAGVSAAKGAPPNCQIAIIRHGSADAAAPATVETRAFASDACLPQLDRLKAAVALLEKPVHSAPGRFEMVADCIHNLNPALADRFVQMGHGPLPDIAIRSLSSIRRVLDKSAQEPKPLVLYSCAGNGAQRLFQNYLDTELANRIQSPVVLRSR